MRSVKLLSTRIHRIRSLRSFYLKYPYETIDDNFLPPVEKSSFSLPQTPISANKMTAIDKSRPTDYKDFRERFRATKEGHRLTVLTCGHNYYGQCGYVSDKFEKVEVNTPHFDRIKEG